MSDARCSGVINSVLGTKGVCGLMVTARRSIVVAATLFVSPILVLAEDAIINFDLITLPTDLVAVVVNIEDDISVLHDVRTQIVSVTEDTASDETDASAIEIKTEIDSTEISQEAVVASTTSTQIVSASTNNTPSETVIQVATEVETGARIAVAEPISATVEANIEVAAVSALPEPVVEPEPDAVEAEPMIVEPDVADTSTQGSASDTAVVASTEIVASTEPKPEAVTASEQGGATTDQITELPASGADPVAEDSVSVEVATVSGSNQGNDSTVAATIVEQVAILKPQVTEQQEQRINEDEIILSWATAWSNNDVEQYLSFYDKEFKPANPKLDRESWEQLRRKRLKNQEIKIIVSNAEIYRADDNTAEVRFTQRYTSKAYRDRVIKSIEMIETQEGWKFLSEQTLEELPFK